MVGRLGWRAVAGGVGLGLSAGWNLANVGAIGDETARAYGVSLAVVGIFTTALFVMHAVMQIPAGRLADRLGARRIGLAGLAVVAVCSAGALATPSPALAIAMRTLTGIGTAVCFIGGSDYIRAAGGTRSRRASSALLAWVAPGSGSRSCRRSSGCSTGARRT